MERYFDRIANDALVMEKWKRVEELKEMGIKPFGERFDKKNMRYIVSYSRRGINI